MKKGDMVKFPFEGKIDAYGIILWINGDELNIDYKNPITYQMQMIKKQITEVVKIGNK